MKIRQIQDYDVPKLLELHSRLGAEYLFPNLDEFFPIPTIVDSHDNPVVTVAALPTAEIYYFGDPDWETPGMRMEAFKIIHEFVRRDLLRRGIVEVNAFLPRFLCRSFGRRLKSLEWEEGQLGPCFSRRVDGKKSC
jgi:hypothetical protein